jgi:hypothetical protein
VSCRKRLASGSAGAETGVVEIACDESGSEGEKLIGATTDVFAHAGVRLDPAAAAGHVEEIRRRAPARSVEYKAYHLLRERHRSALVWLLGGRGPLCGNAHVYLADKAFLVVRAVVDLLVERPAEAMALALYREGRHRFDSARWQDFLVSSNNLLRVRNRKGVPTPVDTFLHAVHALRAGAAGEVADVLALLGAARARADSFRARPADRPAPTLDPLIPAVAAAVAHWGAGGQPVTVVHDRQNALSDERVARLTSAGGLAGLRLVDSRADARVQVADVLAGAARKIASDELNGHGDAELTALLRPYVDRSSTWGDDRSRPLLVGQ